MRVLSFNDPHFSTVPPACRGEDYARQIFAKFHYLIRIAKTIKAEAVVCSGDLFHRKHSVTFRETNQLIAVLRQFPCPIYTVLGNHDAPSATAFDARAVGVLIRSGVVRLLDSEPIILGEIPELIITGTSWYPGIDSDRFAVCPTLSPSVARLREGTDPVPHFHVCHVGIRLPGISIPPFDVLDAEEAIRELSVGRRLPDVISAGHYHIDQGTHEFRVGGRTVTVASIGALSRVSSEDATRTPKALVIGVRRGRIVTREHEIPAEEIQPRETVETAGIEHDAEAMQRFIDKINAEVEGNWSRVEARELLTKIAEELGIGEQSLAAAIEILSKAEEKAGEIRITGGTV